MSKFFLIPLCVLLGFLAEFCLFNIFGRWLMPNVLLLVVIYFNLAFGIRYSIFAAVLAGILKDSFGTGFFGTNIFLFLACAYAVTVFRKYLHFAVSRQSRPMLVFFVVAIHAVLSLIIEMMFNKAELFSSLRFAVAPEIILTLAVTSYVFSLLRKCASRLYA